MTDLEKWKPDTPTELEVTLGESEIILTWKKPISDNLSTLTYQYQIDEKQWANMDNAKTVFAITGLVPNRVYAIRIRSISETDVSEPTEWVYAYTEDYLLENLLDNLIS